MCISIGLNQWHHGCNNCDYHICQNCIDAKFKDNYLLNINYVNFDNFLESIGDIQCEDEGKLFKIQQCGVKDATHVII